MTQIGMGEEEQKQVFEVVAGVLHLGNVDLCAITGEDFPESLITACSLWGLKPKEVYTKLISKDVVGQVVFFEPDQLPVNKCVTAAEFIDICNHIISCGCSSLCCSIDETEHNKFSTLC